jgi:hypothetical protein
MPRQLNSSACRRCCVGRTLSDQETALAALHRDPLDLKTGAKEAQSGNTEFAASVRCACALTCGAVGQRDFNTIFSADLPKK